MILTTVEKENNVFLTVGDLEVGQSSLQAGPSWVGLATF